MLPPRRPTGTTTRRPRSCTYTTASLIAVLQRLPGLVGGVPVILVGDNLAAHRSRQMNDWLVGQTAWLQVVRLPGYAPELNPVEDCGPRARATTWPTTPPPTSPTCGAPPIAACDASAATPLYRGRSSTEPDSPSHQPNHESSLEQLRDSRSSIPRA
ncbi:transposase [Planosporangium thailandense]|uniref:transposase n=1 Tax=Planosporangium thailandense TaxID=765197 RepID=UPI003B837E17